MNEVMSGIDDAATDSRVVALLCPRNMLRPLLASLMSSESTLKRDKAYRITPSGSVHKPSLLACSTHHQNQSFIPLLPLISIETAKKALSLLPDTSVEGVTVVKVNASDLDGDSRRAESLLSGIDRVQRELFRQQNGWTKEEAALIPSKWIIYGDILVFDTPPSHNAPPTIDYLSILRRPSLLAAFQTIYSRVKCLMISVGTVIGELRKPRLEVLTEGGVSETVHVENGVKYMVLPLSPLPLVYFKFDVARIMFAPGNGTERIRMANMKVESGEIVVDMFAGLGYFSIPLLRANIHEIDHHYLLEKNPVSHHYQKINLDLNGLSRKATALLGDNRELAEELVGKVDRILMGYLPNTEDYLARALAFAKPSRAVIHYHHLCKKSEYRSKALDHLQAALEASGRSVESVTIVEFVKVKSYAPQIYHCVADIELTGISSPCSGRSDS